MSTLRFPGYAASRVGRSGVLWDLEDMKKMKWLTFKACAPVAFCALCVLLLPAFGCSSDSDSDNKGTPMSTGGSSGGGTNKMLSCAVSRCINDSASSLFESESDCDDIWNGPCATEYKAYQKCLLDSETCDADGQANVDSISGCASSTEALVKCSADHSM